MSYWTINETCAVLDNRHRLRQITSEDYDKITATMHSNLIYYADEDSNIGLVSVDATILKNSLDVIVNYHLSADDALHVYSAFATKCDYFLCHDHEIVKRTNAVISNMEILDIADAQSMNRLTKDLNSK